MSRLILTVVLFSSFMFSGIIVAQDQPIKNRMGKQHQRIEQGVKSGELTKEEVQQLKDEQKNIRAMKEKAKADGVVTKEEKQQIRAARKTASEHISQEKHDVEKAVKK